MKSTDKDLRVMVRIGSVNTTTCLDDDDDFDEEAEVLRGIARGYEHCAGLVRGMLKVLHAELSDARNKIRARSAERTKTEAGKWQCQPNNNGGSIDVYPLDDLRAHVINGDPCPCIPRTLYENGNPIYKHNSYDRREVGEVMRLALDMLGVLKPPPWLDGEREAYEHAIQLCDMHWPRSENRHPMDRGYREGTTFPFRPKPPEPHE